MIKKHEPKRNFLAGLKNGTVTFSANWGDAGTLK
jgi:hypothetical protein